MGDTITQEIIQVVELDPEIIQVVEIADRGLTGPAGLPVDILAAAPASPTEGYTYYNTTDHKLWYWNGTAWVDVTASADASTLQGQNGAYYLSRDNHTGPSGSKTTPVNADNVVLLDSAASGIAKKLSWANIKATLKTYFDTLYQAVLESGTNIKTINGTTILGSGDLTVSGGGSGDVTGPASSTDNAIARFDGTTGKVVQNSNVTIDDSGFVTTPFVKLWRNGGTGTAVEFYNDAAVTGMAYGMYFTTTVGTLQFLIAGSQGMEIDSNAGVSTKFTLRYGGNRGYFDLGYSMSVYGGPGIPLKLGAGNTPDYLQISTAGVVQFHGTASGFPGLKRSGAALQVRLADDSAHSDLEVADESYSNANWDGSLEVPTKNAIRDAVKGLDRSIQEALSTNGVAMISPDSSTAFNVVGMPAPTAVGTVSHPALASTNFRTQLRRGIVTSAATANSVSELRSSVTQCWRGNAAGMGGFCKTDRFAVSSSTANQQVAVGLFSTTSAISTTQVPSALTNCVFAGWDAADANLQIMSNDGSGTCTKVDLGSNFPANNTTAVYEVTFYAAPNDTQISYRVVRLDTGNVATGTITTDLPTSTTFLAWHAYANNGGTAAAVVLELIKMYLSTEV